MPETPAERSPYHASSSNEAIALETQYGAHNYHSIPVVSSKAQGTCVWDPEGNQYLDFLSAYSAVNQGHCHPELVKALADQAGRLTLSSRAFYNDVFPRFAQMVTEYFGFDMVLPMNTGAEAVETATKIARKWGYKNKMIEPDQALILTATNNFHGRTVCFRRVSGESMGGEGLMNSTSACRNLAFFRFRRTKQLWPLSAQRRPLHSRDEQANCLQ